MYVGLPVVQDLVQGSGTTTTKLLGQLVPLLTSWPSGLFPSVLQLSSPNWCY